VFLYNIVKTLANIILRLFYRIEVIGKNNIPIEGRLILCSNHINLLDPVILSMVVPRHISWMAKKELFQSKIIGYLFKTLGAFPVDRNESDISAVKNSLRLLKKDGALGIFPEGTRVSKFDIKNVKPGIALISVKSKSPILPVYIEGKYRIFSRIKVYFGQPIEFSNFYEVRPTTNDYNLLSQDILRTIYSIKSKEEEVK